MSAARPRSQLTLLFTCVGRRVELLQAFRAAARRRGTALTLIGTDSLPSAPALACVDEPIQSPPVSSPNYAAFVTQLVRTRRVHALIPTIDTELMLLAGLRPELEKLGCQALVPDAGAVQVCADKLETHAFLSNHAIDTPRTASLAQVSDWQEFPCFLKPRFGSASRGARRINDAQELAFFLPRTPQPILQEFVAGVEHTLDVYVGLSGRPQCVVPRRRWETRSGEVSKGVVVKDQRIMAAGRQVVQALGDSVRGVVTLQCILTSSNRLCFIEINPRFGGGAPLAIAAGADFPDWLLAELQGEPGSASAVDFLDGLCMLRHDWSVFAPVDSQGMPDISRALRPAPDFDVPREGMSPAGGA